MTSSDLDRGFTVELTAEVVAVAEHPADLTAEQRKHLGLPADDEQEEK